MEDTSTETIYGSNNDNWDQYNMLQIRLDTERVIREIEAYLKGERLITIGIKDGEIHQQLQKIGEPRANEIGIQEILSDLKSIMNAQTVQGNFDSWKEEDYLFNLRMYFTEKYVTHCYDYGIKDSDISPLISKMMNLLIPFISRLLENQERPSYGMKGQMQHREVVNFSRPDNLDNPKSIRW